MIQVACRCSHRWEVADDLAGLPIQCPQCGLLLDVPRHSDALSLEEDGTYSLDSETANPAQLKTLLRVYHPGRKLDDGSEIDLRGPVLPPPGLRPTPADTHEPAPVDRPRYDPETGELIEALDIREESSRSSAPPIPSQLPVAQRVIDYKSSKAPDSAATPQGLGIFLALLGPINLVVMLIILFAHVALLVSTIATMFIFFLFPAPLLLIIGLVGHYGAVIDDTGPGEQEELPRPLRDVSFYEDLFSPFARVVVCLGLCYWPFQLLSFMYANGSLPEWTDPTGLTTVLGIHPLQILAFLICSCLVPATALTSITSGSVTNLRPDRILGVIREIGPTYFALTALWIIAAGVYALGMACVTASTLSLFSSSRGTNPLLHSYIAFPILAAGIYLMHAFCWQMGMQFRLKQDRFPWVWQQHVRESEPRCAKCHYLLTGNQSGRCPECGTAIPEELKAKLAQPTPKPPARAKASQRQKPLRPREIR